MSFMTNGWYLPHHGLNEYWIMTKLSLMIPHMSFMTNGWYLPHHVLNDYYVTSCLKWLLS
jgi:hypothetical protein